MTLKPPQIQLVMSTLYTGIALIKLVITVAPQNDIWPQGKTYLKNADLITKSKIVTPLAQSADLLKLLKYNLRQI